MSTELAILKNTGKGSDLQFTSFSDKKGRMIQLTQGFGGAAALSQLKEDEPGYIQLSIEDAYNVINELSIWIKSETKSKASSIQKQIAKNEALKKTIFQNAVDCQRFIDDLKILEVPIRLLK